MSEPKKIRRLAALHLFPALGSRLLRWLHASCRWTLVGYEPVEELVRSGRPFICATWHFDLISILYHFRFTSGVVMVSRSRDGEPMARMARRWGYETVRGSRHKGGLDAAREMISLVREGLCAGLVADGSQGPARRAQKGVVYVARATQVPIVPAVVTARRKINLQTWDRTQIPWPFTRLALYTGPPLFVPPGADGPALEKARQELEEALNDLCARAERHPW